MSTYSNRLQPAV